MIYRIDSSSSSTYSVVESSIKTLQQAFTRQTDCMSIQLGQEESFEIRPNDILAVCMIRTQDNAIRPLSVATRTMNTALYVSNIDSACEEGDIRSLTLPEGMSQTLQNLLLVEAIISKFELIYSFQSFKLFIM